MSEEGAIWNDVLELRNAWFYILLRALSKWEMCSGLKRCGELEERTWEFCLSGYWDIFEMETWHRSYTCSQKIVLRAGTCVTMELQ